MEDLPPSGSSISRVPKATCYKINSKSIIGNLSECLQQHSLANKKHKSGHFTNKIAEFNGSGRL